MAEAVIFDVGGVLTGSKSGSTAEDIKSELGLSDDEIRAVWDYYIPTLGSGKISEAQFWEDVARQFGTRLVLPEENLFGRTWGENLQIYNDVLEYARELGRRGIKLAVLSDTNAIHAKILKEKGVYEPFDHLFLSHETGIRKPDPAVFRLALDSLGVEPPGAIFVDDLASNLDAAGQLGMQTVLAVNPEQIINDIEAKL